MNLKDYKPDNPDFDSNDEIVDKTDNKISPSGYQEEINTINIDKLSNKVTIISIIIPCLIGAALIFAYLDMKERVVDVDQTKQFQVDKISHQLEVKLNALDVKIAKNRFDLDNKFPELNKKTVSLEGKITKIANSKIDKKSFKSQFTKLEKRISNNANQDKSTIQTIERINKQTLSTIKENQAKFDKTARQINEEINLFKEEFDARLLELSNYELEIGGLRKDLSLLDKKFKSLNQKTISQAKFDKGIDPVKIQLINLDKQMTLLNKKLSSNISRLQKNIDQLSTISPTEAPKSDKPKPQINIDSSDSGIIVEDSLTK
ncbi:MAG: hypothetical protein GY699_25910 [Desulfobacteraceae bacterium]|nr:hypothetical protein [Desulfobacteraceae bacterium]